MSCILGVAHLEQLCLEPAAVDSQLLNSARPEGIAGSYEHGVLAFFDITAHLVNKLRGQEKCR
jgi:hypothetical protein